MEKPASSLQVSKVVAHLSLVFLVAFSTVISGGRPGLAEAGGVVYRAAMATERRPIEALTGVRQSLAAFEHCDKCTCCGGGQCKTLPCCFVLDCNLPGNPFATCNLHPRECNCDLSGRPAAPADCRSRTFPGSPFRISTRRDYLLYENGMMFDNLCRNSLLPICVRPAKLFDYGITEAGPIAIDTTSSISWFLSLSLPCIDLSFRLTVTNVMKSRELILKPRSGHFILDMPSDCRQCTQNHGFSHWPTTWRCLLRRRVHQC
ncbi:unnamed protein product [Spirodela intermedia]|uniref:DUF7866 domain-containing protein n=1 Tax=Spirodela intermedia TaxID=51605 RepID=A0A7I8K0A9_SPIIN|nr:unnamed protein product [Spirodela intermedia]